MGRIVAELNVGRAVLDGVGAPFDVTDFADEGKCTVRLAPDAHSQMRTAWSRAHGLRVAPVNAVYDVTWEGNRLRVVVAAWRAGFERVEQSIVVADTDAVARAFTQAVCMFCNAPGRSVLRFMGGCWSRSHDLWEQVQGASFDDLVLAGDLKARIQEDFTTFLAAKAEYERYGVPHKRGVLFLGPPGNGKTHCLRAVIKLLDVPCLYVQSLKDRYGTEDANIEQVFARARETSPCCLVFEDLDAMIHDKNRSAFLNQLDGLASLDGVLTLATTNHPERLDPAILERPSRFDRKYHFGLPEAPERHRYLGMWNAKLDAAMRIADAELATLVEATHDFSFAYLKELYVSSMVRWMVQRKPGTMAAELKEQLEALRAQMKTGMAAMALVAAPGPIDDDEM
ncbi:MAG: ATP-binding protein [Deltaproteobacteria bacterium]|nr:ATP-binding protein [Deltaproteobacteria bacterium]